MMSAERDRVRHLLWGDLEPLPAEPASRDRVDVQGWGSDHPYLAAAIEEVRPSLVVEVGVWKGASVITMASRLKALGLDAVVVAVDTWLGAWDHWMNPDWFGHLQFEAGYPTLYRTFQANILAQGLERFVVPLPLDSLNASAVFRAKSMSPALVHIDGGHDFHAVTADLRVWWPLLRPGGVLIGDDYSESGDSWPEVRKGFQTFFATTDIRNQDGKCMIRKGPDGEALTN